MISIYLFDDLKNAVRKLLINRIWTRARKTTSFRFPEKVFVI